MKALALPNERHEQFARLVALGMMLVYAYKQAGLNQGKSITKAVRQAASKLATKPDIRKRIEVLRAEAAARFQITTDSLIRDACQCRDLGIELGQIGAAVQAVKELGILTGLRVEKRETRRVSADMISDDELAAIIAAGPPIEGLAAPNVGVGVGVEPQRLEQSATKPMAYAAGVADMVTAKAPEFVTRTHHRPGLATTYTVEARADRTLTRGPKRQEPPE